MQRMKLVKTTPVKCVYQTMRMTPGVQAMVSSVVGKFTSCHKENMSRHTKKGPYGFLGCGSSNALAQSPVVATDMRWFCLKLP